MTVVGVAPSPRPPDGFLTVRCINGSNSSVGMNYTIGQVNGYFPFVLNSTTGSLSVAQDLVYATQTSYSFSVWCHDNLSPNLSSNASVTISVIEVDKYKPVITPSYLFLTLNETTPLGTVLASTRRDVGALHVYNATDMDVGPQGALHYNLYYSDPHFSADGTFGTLTVQQPLNVDYIGATTFINIIITACDPHVCSSDFNLYITILRQNDYYPMFSQKVYSVTYNDGTPPGQMIPSMCTDQDIGVGALQGVVFLNTTPGVFSLNASTGALNTSISMDYRIARGYTVVLLCRDTGGLTNISIVYVTITPPPNYSPLKFSDLFFIFNVSRATPLFTPVGQLTAKDENVWATLTYLIDKNPYFTITNGTIQTNTSVYDYMCDVMVLNVSVTDGVYTDLTVVYIVLIANTTAEPSSQATPTVIPTAPNGTSFHPASSSADRTVVPTSSSADRMVVPTSSSADRTVVPTSSSADHTVVPTSSSADRTVVSTASSADRTVVPTASSADRTVAPTSSSADRTVVPTPSSADCTVVPTSSSADRTVVPTPSSSKAAITPPTIPASCFITNQATPPPSSVSPSTSIVLPIILTLVCGLALVVAILLFVCLICCHCWRISHKDKTQESP